mmetsp:Transcript_53096/g.107919  ORF Transcript_53096/g.107919 Transcript_53096/m.107919 type:complete len:281 (+) Transcript_53096:390-1232(+)
MLSQVLYSNRWISHKGFSMSPVMAEKRFASSMFAGRRAAFSSSSIASVVAESPSMRMSARIAKRYIRLPSSPLSLSHPLSTNTSAGSTSLRKLDDSASFRAMTVATRKAMPRLRSKPNRPSISGLNLASRNANSISPRDAMSPSSTAWARRGAARHGPQSLMTSNVSMSEADMGTIDSSATAASFSTACTRSVMSSLEAPVTRGAVMLHKVAPATEDVQPAHIHIMWSETPWFMAARRIWSVNCDSGASSSARAGVMKCTVTSVLVSDIASSVLALYIVA